MLFLLKLMFYEYIVLLEVVEAVCKLSVEIIDESLNFLNFI